MASVLQTLAASAFLVSVAYYVIYRPLYNIFLHPLRQYPGPKLWAATDICYALVVASGRQPQILLGLHEKYGGVVRVGPNDLSYIDDAWDDIMGHRKAGEPENGRHPASYHDFRQNILGADREYHRRFRKVLSHGFSAQAMYGQEPLIKSSIDLLMKRLRSESQDGEKPVNMMEWLNYTTFDVISDLTFGEPFGCLQSAGLHPWVRLVCESIRPLTLVAAIRRVFPSIDSVLSSIPSLSAQREAHEAITRAKVAQRIAMDTDRPDFISSMLHNGLTSEGMNENASLLIVGGSETTATSLSGAVYYLCSSLDVQRRLAAEVRQAFQHQDDIDMRSTAALNYLGAVIDECLRIYPPAPTPQPRLIAPGGAMICGKFVPEGAVVNIAQWTMYHSPRNFTRPDSFCPERWLGDASFASDKRELFQPFSFGPRNCIGRNLAYAEMRVILSKLVWNFDMELVEDSRDWVASQRIYASWEKGPLNVYLKPVHRG